LEGQGRVIPCLPRKTLHIVHADTRFLHHVGFVVRVIDRAIFFGRISTDPLGLRTGR
jgi:hypothetical protein